MRVNQALHNLIIKLEKISREGPKWGPEIYVDVISKIHDANTNRDHYVRVKNIYVERTD